MALRPSDMGTKPNRNAPLPPIEQKPQLGEMLPFGMNQAKPSKFQKSVEFQDQQEDNDGERKKDNLLQAPNHYSSLTHATYLTDEHFRTCYSASTRFGNFLRQSLQCRDAKLSYVHFLHIEDQKYRSDKEFPEITEKEKKQIDNKVISLKIIGTSSLELDTNIMHPFVRIHIVNMTSGVYVSKSNGEDNAIYNFESNCVVDKNADGQKERKSCVLEFIPPFSTNFCDMRMYGSSRAVWNEEIYLNEFADHLYNPEVVFLFEILDFNPMYLQAKKIEQLDADYFYRIAWGYVRPMGLAKLHQGHLKIQLYKYVFDSKLLNQSDRKEATPLVYFDFIWPTKVEYNCVLNILYLPKSRPLQGESFDKSMTVFDFEKGDRELRKKTQGQQVEDSEEEEKDELTDQDKKNLRRRRFDTEECQIPNKIEYKYASAQLGCYRLCFNRKGNYLAAACTQRSSKTIIKIFDVEVGTCFVEFKGHSNIIHDLRFSPQSLYLISVSSDQLAKVWRVPKNSTEVIQQEESDHYLIATLSHPSYIYSGLFIRDGIQCLIATCCFDSRLRIWKVDTKRTLQVLQDPEQVQIISTNGTTFDQFEDLIDHRHPNCMAFDDRKKLYIGDSRGGIHIYNIDNNVNTYEIATRQAFVLNPEMEGDAINALNLIPKEMQDLLVHSRDNCLRRLEIQSEQSKYSEQTLPGQITGRYFGSISQKLSVRSAVSPCGQYVISGGEDGKPHLWDILGINLETDVFEYSLVGPVADVAWNSAYHMVALAGFGDEHPICVYVYELPEDTTLQQYKALQERLRNQMHGDKAAQENMNDFGAKMPNQIYRKQMQPQLGPPSQIEQFQTPQVSQPIKPHGPF